MNKISIIIPMLNEADNISNLLNHLSKNSSKQNIAGIIIVDGGSTDGSQSIISKFKNITLLHSEKGRAKQINLGAKNAKGNILYFLHADSFPPQYFDKHIINEIENGNDAGCFRMKFNSNHWWLKLAGLLTCLPWKSCRGGDQSQFITKSLFYKIGGFNEDFKIGANIPLAKIDTSKISFTTEDSHVIFDPKIGVFTMSIYDEYDSKFPNGKFIEFWAIPSSFKTVKNENGYQIYTFKAKISGTEPRKDKRELHIPVIILNCILEYQI